MPAACATAMPSRRPPSETILAMGYSMHPRSVVSARAQIGARADFMMAFFQATVWISSVKQVSNPASVSISATESASSRLSSARQPM